MFRRPTTTNTTLISAYGWKFEASYDELGLEYWVMLFWNAGMASYFCTAVGSFAASLSYGYFLSLQYSFLAFVSPEFNAEPSAHDHGYGFPCLWNGITSLHDLNPLGCC